LSHAPPPDVIETAGEEAHHDHPDQQAAKRLVRDQTDDQRHENRDQSRKDHLLLGGRGDDAHAWA